MKLKIGTKVKLVNPEDFDFDEDDSGEGFIALHSNNGDEHYVEFNNGLKRWVHQKQLEIIKINKQKWQKKYTL